MKPRQLFCFSWSTLGATSACQYDCSGRFCFGLRRLSVSLGRVDGVWQMRSSVGQTIHATGRGTDMDGSNMGYILTVNYILASGMVWVRLFLFSHVGACREPRSCTTPLDKTTHTFSHRNMSCMHVSKTLVLLSSFDHQWIFDEPKHLDPCDGIQNIWTRFGLKHVVIRKA